MTAYQHLPIGLSFVRLCERICHFALWILPICFLLSFAVLFLIWQQATLGLWLAPIVIFIMAAATIAFMVASLACRTPEINAWLSTPESASVAPAPFAAAPIRFKQMPTRTCRGSCCGGSQFSVDCFHPHCAGVPDTAAAIDAGSAPEVVSAH
ncbi:hypothetical protein RAS12_17915 [Achromobacter seleniivolatilans]|uniref:Uncharacterized protein n=1 Tax=Achromobacter seleniivolatilans TaxID=3047478 RepID=A0ABY9LUQ0_9BURK|nr:hypothetical protein [Achromobacter sp. R39]WMD18516.1 hypothetical protein RAS12_17915 [Achromobacter sp. R39]